MDIKYKIIPPALDETLIIPENVHDHLIRRKYRIIYVIGGAGFGKTSLLSLLSRETEQDNNIWFNIDVEDTETDNFLKNLFNVLQAKFRVKKKAKEDYFDYIIRVLNDKFKNGNIYIDNAHSLGPSSEMRLYKIIKNSPYVNYIISKRPSPVMNEKEILYDSSSLVITEKELNFTVNDIKKILKIMKMPLKYAKLIYLQSRGYPFASKLMAFSCKGKKENKFLAGDKMEILFDGLLSQFKTHERKLIILSSLLPDSVFPLLINKISGFPSVDDLRNKGIPIVVLRDTFQYHITFNNYLKRKSIEIDNDERNIFFKGLLKATKNKYVRYVIYYMLRDFETLENEISHVNFSKLHKSVFGGLYLIDSGTLDKNIAMEKMEAFPHLYLFFSFMFAQEVNQIQFTLQTEKRIVEILTNNIENYAEDWREMAFTMIVAFAAETGNIPVVLKYGPYLLEAIHNRGIVAVAISSYASVLASAGEVAKAKNLWKLAREWGEKYNWIFAVINSAMSNIEHLIKLEEDYDSAFPIITEAIHYAEKRDIINAQFYLYSEMSEYYIFKREYEKAIIYANKAMEIADYLRINEWKISLYSILFRICDSEDNVDGMNKYLKLIKEIEESGSERYIDIIDYLSARYYLKTGKFKMTLKLTDRLLQTEKCYNFKKDEIAFTRVLALVKLGRNKDATKELKHLIEANSPSQKPKLLIKYYSTMYDIEKDRNYLVEISKIINEYNLWEDEAIIEKHLNLLYEFYNNNIDKKTIESKLRKMKKFNRIKLLGEAKLFLAGNERVLKEKKIVELLILLLLHYGKMVSRDKLVEWLYPDYDENGGLRRAKNNLRKSVSRLNKILGGKFVTAISIRDGGYILDLKDVYTSDLNEFLYNFQMGTRENNMQMLLRAFELYDGNLVENFEYMADKIEEYRENLKEKFEDICERLKKYKNLKKIGIEKNIIDEKLDKINIK